MWKEGLGQTILYQTSKKEKSVRKKRRGEPGHLSKGREVEQLVKPVDSAPELKANAA